jgi:membrane protein implicated in regulation of membrane protease activity
VTGWEFWRSVLAQALGTILGGAILALAGIAIGAIHGVSLLAVSLVALVFAVIGIAFQVFALVMARRAPRVRERRRRKELEEMASEYSEEEIQNKGIWLFYSEDEKAELLEIYARKQEER